MSNFEKKSTCGCHSCKNVIPLENAIACKICNIEDSDNDDDKKIKETLLFCKRCTNKCYNCDVRGCRKCVNTVCCDCCVSMCAECRDNNNILCGCYGNCYICNTDVNLWEEGWPCDECNKWYCDDCRHNDNQCIECNPNE